MNSTYTLRLHDEWYAELIQRVPTEDPTVDFVLSHGGVLFTKRRNGGPRELAVREAGRTTDANGCIYAEFLALDGSAMARVAVNARPAELGYQGRERLDVCIMDGSQWHGLLHRQAVRFESVHTQVSELGWSGGPRMVSSYRYRMEWDGELYRLATVPPSRRTEMGATHMLDLARGPG